jgi:hypothetical protein
MTITLLKLIGIGISALGGGTDPGVKLFQTWMSPTESH